MFPLALLLVSQIASGPEDSLDNQPYDLELPVTTLVGDHRIVGLAGAYTSIAEGSAGARFNPASFGVRHPYSRDWWDWDVHFDLVVVGLGDSVDVENNGSTQNLFQQTKVISGGLNLQFNDWGLGISVLSYEYSLDKEQISLRVKTEEAVAGWGTALFDGQFSVGVSLLGALMKTNYENTELDEGGVVEYKGNTWSFGAVYRPRENPWRLGATFTLPMRFYQEETNMKELAGRKLPDSMTRPLKLSVGASWYFPLGNTRYNQNASDKVVTDRRYILVSSDVVFLGAGSSKATGLEGYAARTMDPIVTHPTLGLSVGVESEVLDDRLKVRAGMYLEPSRFVAGNYRLHGTAGGEVRLFRLWEWQLRFATTVDLAPDYQNLLFGIGFWH